MSDGPLYVCGHSPQELARLQTQSVFFEPITRRMLEAAGVAPGMCVLDVGCGAGDVSLLTSDLVGPEGRVVGIDRARQAVEAAAARAESLGRRHVEFRVSDVETLASDATFDAVVGRFVLMHQADPAQTLRCASRHVRPGGIIAMIESHMRGSVDGVHSHPPSPTYDRIVRWMIAVIEAAGAHADMGLRLRETFLAAGLPEPVMSMEARVEGGPDAPIYRYTIDSLCSMLPMASRFGIVSGTDDDMTSLEATLSKEVMSSGGVLTSPLIVGAWCRMRG